MKYWFALSFLFFGLLSFGQQTSVNKQLVQVSGLVTDIDSSNVVPYVSITNAQTKQVFLANYAGYFSFVAKPGDTLLFTAVGYKNITHVVPAGLTENKYTLMVKIKAEITMLQAVRIYPWATVEDFTRSFLALKIADDDIEIAKKNLSGKSLRQLGVSLPFDAGEITNTNYRLAHDRALNKNMVQTNPLLNPFAWGRLLQSIMNGDKSRQADN